MDARRSFTGRRERLATLLLGCLAAFGSTATLSGREVPYAAMED
jgi:hypothetical protein